MNFTLKKRTIFPYYKSDNSSIVLVNNIKNTKILPFSDLCESLRKESNFFVTSCSISYSAMIVAPRTREESVLSRDIEVSFGTMAYMAYSVCSCTYVVLRIPIYTYAYYNVPRCILRYFNVSLRT